MGHRRLQDPQGQIPGDELAEIRCRGGSAGDYNVWFTEKPWPHGMRRQWSARRGQERLGRTSRMGERALRRLLILAASATSRFA
jgi:hypothetical protein